MAKIDGIDISYANPQVDFAKVKAAGTRFVMIRTGYLGKTDDRFLSHVRGALKAGLDVGVYCYCLAESEERAEKDAQYVLELIKPFKLTYPVCYDVEDERLEKLPREKLTAIAAAFLGKIREAGYRAALYANPSWLENKLNFQRLSGCDLWLAHWTNSASKPSPYSYGQSMWQWGAGSVPGVSGKVDRDISFTDYAAAQDLSGTQTAGKTVSTVYLNIRSKPSLAGIKLGVIPPGREVTVSGSAGVADGYEWVKIRFGTISGYVARRYLKEI